MKRFFDPNSLLWRGFSRIADFFGLSICWLVCCLPILTLFPACIALYDSVGRCLVQHETGLYRRFFRTFRFELKRGIGLSCLWLGLTAVLVVGYQILGQAVPANLKESVRIFYLACMSAPVCVVTWLIPIESRFEYSFTDLHKTAVAFALTQLPATAFLLAVLILSAVIHFFMPYVIMVLPAITVYVQGWMIERVFHRCTEDVSA